MNAIFHINYRQLKRRWEHRVVCWALSMHIERSFYSTIQFSNISLTRIKYDTGSWVIILCFLCVYFSHIKVPNYWVYSVVLVYVHALIGTYFNQRDVLVRIIFFAVLYDAIFSESTMKVRIIETKIFFRV